MNKVKSAALLILVLLGASAGAVKIIKMPQELEFFESVGMNELSLVFFGIAQLSGSVLLIFRRSRLLGLLVSALAFLASAIMIFSTGALGFGALSLLPALMSGWLVWDNMRSKSAVPA